MTPNQLSDRKNRGQHGEVESLMREKYTARHETAPSRNGDNRCLSLGTSSLKTSS